MYLEAKEIMKIHVKCDSKLDVGNTTAGYLRVIPIIGGNFEGEIKGRVVPGGADWNTAWWEHTSHVFAKYLLQTEDGEFISVENEGRVDFTNQDKRIKTSPRFQADVNGKYAWLNIGVYVGELHGGKELGEIEITVYQLC